MGTFTVSKTSSGKYFVSILVHVEEEIKQKPIPKSAVGMDFGLKTFITTSDGNKYTNPEFLKQNLVKLARLQRTMSRRINGSSNKNKARIKVARLHEKISNQRRDYLHKLSHKFVHENQVDTICVEDLNLTGMQKLWGRKTSDLSWYEFTRQLQYKCDWYGKNFIKIGRFDPSSKMCSNCGSMTNLELSDRNWTCSKCNVTHDRDINAAKNVKDFGMNQYQLRQELSDVKSVEKKALVKRNRKKSNDETVFVEAEKKKVYVISDLKPIDL